MNDFEHTHTHTGRIDVISDRFLYRFTAQGTSPAAIPLLNHMSMLVEVADGLVIARTHARQVR